MNESESHYFGAEEILEFNMKYVGYAVGRTIGDLKNQWVDLWGGEVNHVIFDRESLKGFDLRDVNEYPEKKEISNYIEAMRGGQWINWNARQNDKPHDANDICYDFIEDLLPGDRLVLTSLEVLQEGRPDIWDKIMDIHAQGSFLVVLSDGFSSSGEYGDVMIKMMDELYRFGLSKGFDNNNLNST